MVKLPQEIGARAIQTTTSGIYLPVNLPSDGQVITYSGTTGNMHWDNPAAGGGGGGGAVAVEDEGVEVVAEASTFNFVGPDVLVEDAGAGQVNVTISGIGNAAAGSRWEFIETVEVTGSAVSELGFTGLDGDTDEQYLLTYYLIHAESGTLRNFRLRVNDLDSAGNVSSTSQNSAGAHITYGDMVLTATVRDYLIGHLVFNASERPEGGAVDIARSFTYHHTLGDSPAVNSTTFDQTGSGLWTDAGVNITSLKVESTVNGADTPSTSIEVGSIMSLYKKVPNDQVVGVSAKVSVPLQHIETLVVDSATDSVTFDAVLDSDLDEHYIIYYDVIEGATNLDHLEIKPNNTTVGFGSRVTHETGSNEDQPFWFFSQINADKREAGIIEIQARQGETRTYWATSSFGRVPATEATQYTRGYSGTWDTPTKITSLTFETRTETGTSIAAGSRFDLYKLTSSGTVNVAAVLPLLDTRDEGSSVQVDTKFIDFAGGGVTATASGTGTRVEIPSIPNLVTKGNGTTVSGSTTCIDFAGEGITATASGNCVRVQVEGNPRRVPPDSDDQLVYDGTTSAAGATLVNVGQAASGDLTRTGSPVHDTVGLFDKGIRNPVDGNHYWQGASTVEPTSVTLSLWMKWAGLGDGFQPLFFKRAKTGTTWASPYISVGMRLTSAGLLEGFISSGGTLSSNIFLSAPSTWMATVPAKEWQHVGMTFDGSTFEFKGYLNGEAVVTVTAAGAIDYDTSGEWNTLANGSTANETFQGDIEDIRVADIVRPASWFEDVWRRGFGFVS